MKDKRDSHGSRTRVTTVKGWCPGPLDEGVISADYKIEHQHSQTLFCNLIYHVNKNIKI